MTLPLMIFAAGRGTRMGALAADRPKPMIEVAGRPLVDHAIALGRDAGARPIVANTHHLRDRVEPHLLRRGVVPSPETPDILDTGGGLRQALPLLGPGPVLTLNSDVVWTGPNPLPRLAAAWRPGMGALLMCVPLSRAHGRRGGGDFSSDTGGRLTRGGDLVYTGAQVIDPSALAPETARVFSLSAVWSRLAGEGRLHGLVHPGDWADVGHPGGIAAAEALLARV
jgi:N-acetyl-alpha-D-muramate 1-phosphate uridylyltransferase